MKENRHMPDWTNETPTAPGQYWFVGDPFDAKGNSDRVELHYASIKSNSNGHLFFISDGNFMDNKKGLWMKVEMPTLPDGLTVRIV
jgi:hypothetical protein